MWLIEILFLLNLLVLAVFGLHAMVLTLLFLRRRRRRAGGSAVVSARSPTGRHLPWVTIQIPVFNERHVVTRAVDAAAALDWPAGRLEIQLLDDSTDDTTRLAAVALRRAAARGIACAHIRRPNRAGFKAGALRHGLALARGKYLAILDADFLPAPDFLRRIMPTFNNPDVGCVQARWGHLNPFTSSLTGLQALGIDGHFIVEQSARDATGAFLNFNGTAGVWRRRCIVESGGWQGDTLTEDLDLSYRAQLAGWRIAYRPDIVMPGELPVQVEAFKSQQFRWAKGSIQTARKLLGRLWRSHHPLWRKTLGTLHLTGYVVHPLMLFNLFLFLPISFSDSPLLMTSGIFTLAMAGPLFMYDTALRVNGVPFAGRLRRLATMTVLGTGLAFNNGRAVFEALAGVPSGFARTPKFAVTGQSAAWLTSGYRLAGRSRARAERLLTVYAAALLGWHIAIGSWGLVIWLLLYLGGFAYMAFFSLWQTRQVARLPRVSRFREL